MPHQLSQTKLKRTANKARKHVSIAHAKELRNQFHFEPMFLAQEQKQRPLFQPAARTKSGFEMAL